MNKSTIFAFAGMMLFASCSRNIEYLGPLVNEPTAEEISANVEKVFGVTFDPNQDWCTTTNGKVTITINNSNLKDVEKVMILTKSPFGNRDANGSLSLNETEASFGQSVTLYYDAPKMYSKLWVACVTKSGEYFAKSFNVGENHVNFTSDEKAGARTRSDAGNFNLEALVQNLTQPTIASSESSINNQRCSNPVDPYTAWDGTNWGNDLLYNPSSLNEFVVDDYTDEYKSDLYDMIFKEYLVNKKENIAKVKLSDYFIKSDNYPLITEGKPVVMAPVYRNDGRYHEVEHCDLYYYYFKDSDLPTGSDEAVANYLKTLPKYKAINLGSIINDSQTPLGNDDIYRHKAFALVYWGDAKTPAAGTEGQFTFPAGYKLGFMIRSNDPAADNKTGELYCDGHLNDAINTWGHFATAGLQNGDPRMAWFKANGRDYLCCETGSDQDINDVVFEVLGGIMLPPPPVIDKNMYTFCFEDTPKGDYDLNDVVIRAYRKSATEVVWQVVACGAKDEVYIKNINGDVITEEAEVHALMGKSERIFINTENRMPETEIVEEVVPVPESFSFLNKQDQPYIYDKTNNHTTSIALAGQDPHGIMVPYNFRYPLEKICIKNAYLDFNKWGQGAYITDVEIGNEWYLSPVDGKVTDANPGTPNID